MDQEEIEKVVLVYLDKRGFKQAGLDFQQEKQQSSNTSSTVQIETDAAKQSLEVGGPALLQDGYNNLRSWAYSSLEQYQNELVRVLYPVFVYVFTNLVARGHIQEARAFFNSFRGDHEMIHSRDLQKLEGVLSPSHLEEMEFAHSLRQSKVRIKICQYSYDLLLQYLNKHQSTDMPEIINDNIIFQVSPGKPSSVSDDAEFVMLYGSGQDTTKSINQREIHWEKRSADGGKQGTTLKKVKKDKVAGTTAKASCSESTTVPKAPCIETELALPVIPIEVERCILSDLRNRVQLSCVALPSISFYTLVNSQNGFNCASISHDGSLLAGGFSDSSLKVWDMAKLGQQSGCFPFQGENVLAPNEHIPSTSSGERSYTLFRGHAGPVHSASFSPPGDFFLSSSADSTIRLWSTKLNANIVCYKGHNYPVWDVQFSPLGHYFASASHDRTARIWSVDRSQPLRIMAGHLSDVDCVQWHANCNYIATGSSDKTVRLWDVQSGECVRIFVGHRSMILSLAMSPDGCYMASGDEDGTIMIWDLATGRCVSPLVGHSSCIWSLAFSCEGSVLASGSADCTVKIWDVNESLKVPKNEDNKNGSANRLRLLKTLPTKSTPVYALQFTSRTLLFAAGAL